MNIPDLINDFLVDVRKHDGFVSDKNFDRVAAEVFKQKIKEVIEACAKKADDEVMRLDRLSIEYKRKGDLETATRFSACTVISARLGRIIRALAAPGENK